MRRRRVGLLAVSVALGLTGATQSLGAGSPKPSCPSGGTIYNVDPPVLTGSTAVGGVLTTSLGTWRNADGSAAIPQGYYFSWWRDGFASGTSLNVGTRSYTVTAADQDHGLQAHVVAYIGAGTCGIVGSADSNMAYVDPADNEGPPASDQTDPTADTTDYGTAAAPVPQSQIGPAPAGTYTTTAWDPDETESPDGLQVVDSTSSGSFALTGVVVDANTGNPVTGATATLSRTAGTLSTYSTGASGGFAFIDMPTPSGTDSIKLVVSAPGYGSYTLTNVSSDPDQTYQASVLLDATAQTWDDATLHNGDATGAFTQNASTSTVPGRYQSNRHVPPNIRVAQYRLDRNCAPARDGAGNATYLGTRKFQWRYYVLHVVDGEIKGRGWPGGYFDREATKSVMSGIQNFAWYYRLRSRLGPPYSGAAGANTPYDLTNTTFSQCFVTGTVNTGTRVTLRPQWRTWVNDVLPTRVTDETLPGTIVFTEYRGADSSHPCFSSGPCDYYFNVTCTTAPFRDPYFGPYSGAGANHNRMSQLGAKGAEERCGLTADGSGYLADDWVRIVDYYYRDIGGVTAGVIPPRPNVTTVAKDATLHTLKFTFSSNVGNSQVAWRYDVVATNSSGSKKLCCKTKSSPTGSVQTTFTWSPDACYTYKVRATNPVGKSQYVNFKDPVSGSLSICRP
jgi:hypothetical protein